MTRRSEPVMHFVVDSAIRRREGTDTLRLLGGGGFMGQMIRVCVRVFVCT